MQIVIDTRQCPCRTLNDECDISGHECYEDDICSSCPLIRNGGVKLPKGHGTLKDTDAICKDIISALGVRDENYLLEAEKAIYKRIKNANAIIEADKGE